MDWIDTAPFYGWGEAERIVGEAVQALGEDRPRLFTKCGTVRGAGGEVREDLRPDTIRREVEASLSRLRTERIDVVQFHDPDPTLPIEDSWGALADLVAEGKVAWGGLSNHEPDLLRRAARVHPVTIVQHAMSVIDFAPLSEVVPCCREIGATFLAWSPLAAGLLTRDFNVMALAPGDLRLALSANPVRFAEARAAVERLETVAARHGATVEQVALAWVLAQGVGAISGARSDAEARASASAMDLELDDDDVWFLA
jgi:aryl-alcohol dehydrogenase-like predicted oxidoreductase